MSIMNGHERGERDGRRASAGRAGRSVTIELWVWADRDCLDDEHDLVIERAERLVRRGVVDELRVEAWDHQVDLAGSRPSSVRDHTVRSHLAAFERWATTHGAELPLPPAHRGGVGRMGPETTLQDLPMLLMVEYVGENVAFVTPCETAGRGYAPEERLNRLAAAGEWVPPEPLDESAPTP